MAQTQMVRIMMHEGLCCVMDAPLWSEEESAGLEAHLACNRMLKVLSFFNSAIAQS